MNEATSPASRTAATRAVISTVPSSRRSRARNRGVPVCVIMTGTSSRIEKAWPASYPPNEAPKRPGAGVVESRRRIARSDADAQAIQLGSSPMEVVVQEVRVDGKLARVPGEERIRDAV